MLRGYGSYTLAGYVMTKKNSKVALIIKKNRASIVSVATGLILFILFFITKSTPEMEGSISNILHVEGVRISEQEIKRSVLGYGVVRAETEWNAVSNVQGKVIDVHKNLKDGMIIYKGETLLVIDPSRYILKIAEAKEAIKKLKAQKKSVEIKHESQKRLLQLENKKLGISKKEFSRLDRLSKTGAVSIATVDKQEKEYINQKKLVLSLENDIDLHPAEIAVIDADVNRNMSLLNQYEIDLKDTVITAPFNLRISDVSVNLYQEVGIRQTLLKAYSIDSLEVHSNFAVDTLQHVIKPSTESGGLHASEEFEKALKNINVRITQIDNDEQSFEGQIKRIKSELNPKTRTVQLVAKVNAPYGGSIISTGLPLQPNVYVRVYLESENSEKVIAVPSHLLKNGYVHLLNSDNIVVKKQVDIAYEQAGLSIIKSGISESDVILTTPVSQDQLGKKGSLTIYPLSSLEDLSYD